MSDTVNVGVIGLGKMGISHFALANAHPAARTVICDSNRFLLDVLRKYLNNPIYRDVDAMLEAEPLDAVIVATPSKSHAGLVRKALDRGLDVFCEKPFCLDWRDSVALADLAERRGVVNRVGYHYRHVGAFREMKRIIDSGALGTISHVLAEAYGPVVLQPKRATWRTQKDEGGGCLYDYAAHPLNLLNWFFGTPRDAIGTVLNSLFSSATEDGVYSTLVFPQGFTAQLSVNWSDESHRKMSTKISILGSNGRLYADRQECQLYLRAASDALPDYGKGWTVRYTTELTEPSWFYLRGEEYSNQIDGFVQAALARKAGATPVPTPHDFRAAAETDRTIALLLEDRQAVQAPAAAAAAKPKAQRRLSWFARA